MCRCCFVRESSTSSHVYGCLRIKIDRYIFRINILGATDLTRLMCLYMLLHYPGKFCAPPPGEFLRTFNLKLPCIVIMLWASCIFDIWGERLTFFIYTLYSKTSQRIHINIKRKNYSSTLPLIFFQERRRAYTPYQLITCI